MVAYTVPSNKQAGEAGKCFLGLFLVCHSFGVFVHVHKQYFVIAV